MPIFRAGSSLLNIPEGQYFDCIGSPQTAEWQLCYGMEKGKHYRVSCENGHLVYRELTVDEMAQKHKVRQHEAPRRSCPDGAQRPDAM